MTEKNKEQLIKILRESKGRKYYSHKEKEYDTQSLVSLIGINFYKTSEEDRKSAIKILKESKTKEEALKKLKEANVDDLFIRILKCSNTIEDLLLVIKILKESKTKEEALEKHCKLFDKKTFKEINHNNIFDEYMWELRHNWKILDVSKKDRITTVKILKESKTKEEALKKLEEANVDESLLCGLEYCYLDVFYMSVKDRRKVKSFFEQYGYPDCLKKLEEANVNKNIIRNINYWWLDNDDFISLIEEVEEYETVNDYFNKEIIEKMEKAKMDKKLICIFKYYYVFDLMFPNNLPIFYYITEEVRTIITKILFESETKKEVLEKLNDSKLNSILIYDIKQRLYDFYDKEDEYERMVSWFITLWSESEDEIRKKIEYMEKMEKLFENI